MAETFLFNITERVLSKVASFALNEISLAWEIKPELKRLQQTLSTIKAVLLDADEQQAKNHEVRDWLEKLKDVVYAFDDLLDDLSTQVLLQKEVMTPYNFLKKVGKFFSTSNPLAFRFQKGHQVREIRKRLDQIAADRNKFHFMEQQVVSKVENKVREQTHSFVRASEIVGRGRDKESIVALLRSSSDYETVNVIPIVGLGGLGKTTLVKLVYNDEWVVENFELRMWVCVTEEFSLKKVIEKILKSATGENFGHLDMDQIQSRLRDVLESKRYLLILDDVWNDDRNKWNELMDFLINGTRGSTIVVTTRSKIVATITGTVAPYDLSALCHEDCLDLFLRCAFRCEEDRLLNLLEIGKEIVKKCGGVPLAVKTVGGLLYMKTEEREWLHIRDNDIWEIEQKENDILPVLRLSYEQMPTYLRQCFAYCSIFPKGEEIPRETFINVWIAQGLIQSSPNGNRQLEDIGNLYFNELLSRFCFHDVKEAFDGEILACKIHDLVQDLAQSVLGTECLNVKFGTQKISERVRHVLFHEEILSAQEVLKSKHIRSFSYIFRVRPIGKSFVKAITLNFSRLRVLVLGYLELDRLPRSIGKLMQLRYLNMSYNHNIKTLPESICKLVNLQTLNLINCGQHQELPRNFGKLINLKTLYLTSQQTCFPGKGRQSPNSLQNLLLYKCDRLTLLSEGLKNFSALRVLRVYECQRLASLPSSIKYLSSLEKLWIWNCEELDLFEGEGMEGLKSLRSLLLMGIPKLMTLPQGLKETAATNLQYLHIDDCPNLTMLPDWLKSFTSLLRLYIEGCPNLVYQQEMVDCLTAQVHISGYSQSSGGC